MNRARTSPELALISGNGAFVDHPCERFSRIKDPQAVLESLVRRGRRSAGNFAVIGIQLGIVSPELGCRPIRPILSKTQRGLRVTELILDRDDRRHGDHSFTSRRRSKTS